MKEQYSIEPIGVIHTPFKTKNECPIQGRKHPDQQGIIEIFPNYQEGLQDVDMFSHIFILYLFDRAGEIQLVRPPFLDDSAHGVFACRHPCRPNGIGLSVVKLEDRNENKLTVSSIDVLDGTPLIDIKPFVPRFDVPENATNGWVENRPWREKPEGRE